MELYSGESINFKKNENKNEESLTDSQINAKYHKGEVRIVTEQARYSMTNIVDIVNSKDYILNPEFQRRHRWDDVKKSKLIESFIINIPVPPIFLYEIDYSVYEVMDGLQRLTAISEFYKNKYKLTGLEEWPELNNKNYSQLPDSIKRGIDRRYISAIILLNETAGNDPEKAQILKQMVFERINSGGESLESQETRNALYNGKLNKLCIKLSRDSKFCKHWEIPDESNNENDIKNNRMYRKMEDVELVLRFFAMRQIESWESMTLESFLDNFLKEGNLFDNDVLDKYDKLFKDTMEFSYELLGNSALSLWRMRNGNWIQYLRPTKVIYDPLMRTLSNLLNDKSFLLEKREEIKSQLKDFYIEHYESFEGRNTGKNDILKRTELYEKFFASFLVK